MAWITESPSIVVKQFTAPAVHEVGGVAGLVAK